MFTSLNQIFGVKSRLLLSGLVCLLLVSGLAACQPKQTSTSENAPVAENTPVAENAAAQNQNQGDVKQNPMEDPDYARAIMQKGPEFTEAELLKIYKDMEPVSRGSMAEVVNYLETEKGWDGSRVYYILSKVASGEAILENPANREMIAQDYPEDLPTANELALVQKHRATLHKLIGIAE